MDSSLGFGEAYMNGWWECERPDPHFHRLLAVDVDRQLDRLAKFRWLGALLA
jgi:cyclopropane-fatty-acyl-phospholipid synthase